MPCGLFYNPDNYFYFIRNEFYDKTFSGMARSSLMIHVNAD